MRIGTYLSVSQLTVNDRKQDALNKGILTMFAVLLVALCGLGYWIYSVDAASNERAVKYEAEAAKWKYERAIRNRAWDKKWEEEYGERLLIVTPQSWYTVPKTPQIIQAGFLQTATPTDLTLVGALVAGLVAVTGAMGLMWKYFTKRIELLEERAHKKEDERDASDKESTSVLSALKMVLESLQGIIREMRSDYSNLVREVREELSRHKQNP